MPYTKLDPRAVKMWRVSRAIGLAVLLLLAGLPLFLLSRYEQATNLWDPLPVILAGGGVLILLQLVNLLLYPLIEYRQWAYLITPDRIEIKKGIFFHSTRIIPISRIQHVMVAAGPLARHYHLASVTIHTAGGSLKIEGLAEETAAGICENLKTVVNRKSRLESAPTEG